MPLVICDTHWLLAFHVIMVVPDVTKMSLLIIIVVIVIVVFTLWLVIATCIEALNPRHGLFLLLLIFRLVDTTLSDSSKTLLRLSLLLMVSVLFL